MKTYFKLLSAILAIAISTHMTFAQANVPSYSQRSYPWSTDVLGWGPSYVTIGSDGCIVTGLASIRAYYGNYHTPRTMNNYLKANGGFYGNLVVWGRVPGFRALRDYSYVAADLSYINWWLDRGYLIVAKTYFPPNRVSPHWVVLTGRSGSTYFVMDPWDGAKTTFNARYGSPSRWIYRIAIFGR
jgi:hypothetical protein